MNNQALAQAAALSGQSIGVPFSYDPTRSKIASRRAAYHSHKLAMIKEEIERAKNEEIRDQSDDPAQVITA